jgi:hypothetical protein
MAFVTLPPNLQEMFGQINDRINKLESAPNSVAYEPVIDLSSGTSTYYPKIGSVNRISGIGSNLTLDFQNPPPEGYAATAVVIISQGSGTYYPTSYKISGTTFTYIEWSPQAPTFGTANASGVYTFTFQRYGPDDFNCRCWATVVTFA